MGRLILLAVFLGGSVAQAQIGHTIRDYYTPFSKYSVGLQGSYIVNSTAITTRMGQQVFTGAFIDNETKEQNFGNFTDIHTLGGDFDAGGYFLVSPDTLFKRTGVSWFGAFNQRYHFNGAMPRDAFGLAAFGNARYEGDSANISGLEANIFNYQQLQAGLLFNRGQTGFGISFLKGLENRHLSVPIANLFTAMDGEFIELSMVMSARQTNRERRDFHHVNGIGASADFFTYINFGRTDTFRHRLLVEVKDLGFIRWNNQSDYYRIDSTFYFDGLSIDNLASLTDSLIGPDLSDSALTSVIKPGKEGYISILPGFVHLADIYKINDNITLMSGLMYRWVANYSTYFYIRGFYRFNPRMEASAKVAFGGYGLLNFGASLNFRIRENYRFIIGTENLEGWVAPQYAMGSSAFVGFRMRM